MKAVTLLLSVCIVISSFCSPVFAQPELIGRLEYDFTNLRCPVFRDGFVFAGNTNLAIGEGPSFVVYDVRDSLHFRRIVNIPVGDHPNNVDHVVLVNQTAMITTWQGVWLADISNLEAVEVFGPLENFSITTKCQPIVKDSLIFIPNNLSRDSSELVVAMLNPDRTISVLTRVGIRGRFGGLSNYENQIACAIWDDYSGDGNDGGVRIFDFSNPRSLQQVVFFYRRNVISDYDAVYLGDGFCIAQVYGTYQFIDLRNLNSIRLLVELRTGRYSDPQIFIDGNTAWLAGENYFAVFDVSDPFNPRQGESRRVQYGSPHILAEDDNIVLLSHGFTEARDGISYQDLSDPDSPILINHFNRDWHSPTNALALSEPIVAVAFGTGVSLVDVSDPRQPVETAFKSVPRVTALSFNSAGKLIVRSDVWGIVGLDVSDPANPREIFRGGLDSLSLTSKFKDDYLYLNGVDPTSQRRGVFIFDVSDAENIEEVGFSECTMDRITAFVGSRLYGVSYQNVISIDMRDPRNPGIPKRSFFEHEFVPLGGYDQVVLGLEAPNGRGENWIVQARHLDSDTLVKIPQIGFIAPSNHVNSVDVASNGETFTLSNITGVWTYGNRWGERPYLLGHYDTPGQAVATAYGTPTEESQPMYVADGNSFLVLEGAGSLTVTSPIPPVPSVFSLSVFPNPFNSSLTIKYSGGLESAATRLAIYDINGRLVADLTGSTGVSAGQGFHPAAEGRATKHKVTWDASAQPAGIYLLRLETNNITLSRKIVLMK